MRSFLAEFFPSRGKFGVMAGLSNSQPLLFTRSQPKPDRSRFNISVARHNSGLQTSGFYKLVPKKLIPYIGMGWRRDVEKNFPLDFNVDFGWFLEDKPRATISPFQPVSSRAAEGIQRGVTVEQQAAGKIRADWEYSSGLDSFQIIPTISLGAMFRF